MSKLSTETDDEFDEIITLPDPSAMRKYQQLVGLEEIKQTILKTASFWLKQDQLNKWSEKYYNKQLNLVQRFNELPPLFIFTGDVGTGKTSLAETFGDTIARSHKISVSLFRLSLTARGQGAVGEMTRRLTKAFAFVKEQAQKNKNGGVILLIDEADAIVQSREYGQMHHEDRAGVNAVIRGIDSLSGENLPVVVIMCTNRSSALDPAVKRRAAQIFDFSRPNDKQRAEILSKNLAEVDFTKDEIEELVKATGPRGQNNYGFTYSDLVQRYLPSLLIEAVPEKKIRFEDALRIAHATPPTPPFQDQTAL